MFPNKICVKTNGTCKLDIHAYSDIFVLDMQKIHISEIF